jgi:glutamine synthetase type III
VAKDNYILTAETEGKAMVYTANQSVVPRAYSYLNTVSSKSELPSIKKFADKFGHCFDGVLSAL